jgi:hypothetical protein
LIQWWRVAPAEQASAVAAANPGTIDETGEQPFRLTFGDGYSLRRVEVSADLASATARLQSECRTILERGPAQREPPTASEQRFLARIADRPPLEERRGQWQIQQFEGKLPLMVAVRLAAPSADGLHNPRVAAWGLAMPTDEAASTLLIYEAGAGRASSRQADVLSVAPSAPSPGEDIPLPAGLRRTLTLGGPQGEATIGLAGDNAPRRCVDELDRTLSAAGWTPRGWRQAGTAWHNRYQASGKRPGRIEVQLSDDGRGGTVGLMIVHGERQ